MTENVARQIKEARARKGLTQADVAEAVGVARVTVSDWERGSSVPRLQNLVKLSELLGVSEIALTPFQAEGDSPRSMPRGEITGKLPDIAWVDLGRIAGGEEPAAVSDSGMELRAPEREVPGDFRLQVADTAMSPIYNPGDRIRIRGQDPTDGCQVVAYIFDGDEGHAVLRNYVERRGGAFDLVAEDPAIPTISSPGGPECQILGVVIRHLRVLSGQDDIIV